MCTLRALCKWPAKLFGNYSRARACKSPNSLIGKIFNVFLFNFQEGNLLSMAARTASAFDGTSIGRLDNAADVPASSFL